MSEVWFQIATRFFGAAGPVALIILAWLRWRQPEQKYADNPVCKRHVVYICILCLILFPVLAGIGWTVFYLTANEVTIKTPVMRTKPKDISIEVKTIPYAGQEVWVTDHARWLREEAEGEERAKLISDYVVIEAYHSPGFATPDFNWSLSSSPGYVFSVRAAYRVAGGDRRMVAVMTLEKKAQDAAVITVPPLDKDDMVSIVVKVAALKGKLPGDVRRVLTSRVE